MKKLPSIFRNKFFIAFLVVFAWLMFFDKNNFFQQWRMRSQLKEMQRDREYYLEQIKNDSTAIKKLKEDPDALERYARENYLMKKEGEDIFIIMDDD